MMQMEQWSILSNVLYYIQHDRHHTVNHALNIKAVNKYKNKSETKEEKEPVELDLVACYSNYMKNAWMCVRVYSQK